MGKIPQHFIDELLSRVDIIDVINARVPLKKSGSNHTACCPFHHEKTPSFSVNQAKQFYYCFGCNASGTAISFLMEYDGLPFPDAIETLAESIGLEVPRDQQNTPVQHHDSAYQLLAAATAYYEKQLTNTPSALEYFKKRGLSQETINRFGLGYSPEGWQLLEKNIPGTSDKLLLETGLAIRNDSGRIYDRFRHRIMFPIRDQRGRTIAFGGRVIDQGEPKYLNSPETPLFHKGRELYGLFEARKYSNKLEQLIVVEGYMDVVALAEKNINNAVATLGTATTPDHIERLFRSANDIFFCFDGDKAGRRAAWRALENALPAMRDGREARFLFLPDGEDPDSMVQQHGRDHFLQILSQATPLADFLTHHLESLAPLDSVGGQARFAELAKPLLKKLPRGVYRALLEKKVSSLIGLTLKFGSPPALKPKQSKKLVTAMTPMRMAITCLLQHPALANALPSLPDLPDNTAGADLLKQLYSIAKLNPSISTAAFIEHFREAPEWKIVQKLVLWRLPDNSEMSQLSAIQHFDDSLSNLTLASTKERSTELLTLSQQRSLTAEEKSELLNIHNILSKT